MADRCGLRVQLEDQVAHATQGPLTLTTAITEREWDAVVDAHPQASCYHAWVWREVFEEAFGHKTIYLAARCQGEPVGVLPLVLFRSWLFGQFLVSLPFVNYGGVLAGDEETASALINESTRYASAIQASHVEFRHVARRFPRLASRSHKVAMILSLPRNPETAWQALDRKARNQVRKAQQSGLTVRIGGFDDLDGFYAVFARNMRDLGTPVYPKRFFKAILARFPNRSACVVISSGSTPVAAALTLTHRDTIEVPWASALREYRAACPNNLLYWTLIEQAIATGAARLDFGRSSPESGTYRFKQQWGAVAQPLCWEYGLAPGQPVPNLAPANPRFGVAIAAWKRLPVPVATFVGPHIIRSIP